MTSLTRRAASVSGLSGVRGLSLPMPVVDGALLGLAVVEEAVLLSLMAVLALVFDTISPEFDDSEPDRAYSERSVDGLDGSASDGKRGRRQVGHELRCDIHVNQ